MSLNSLSPVPLYRQLAEQIRSDINAGVYKVAERIPSETEFADRLSIGRPTVRQATDLLVRQGYLERRRGSGTYVLPPSKTIDLFSLAGTSAALSKSGQAATLELISGPIREPLTSTNKSGSESDNAAGECVRIDRKASVDGIPVMFETLRFEAVLFTGLEKQTIANQSLSALVRDVFFLEPTSANQSFFVITADEIMAKQLDVGQGTPLLHVRRELHFGEHRSALHADIVCRTDRFEFSQKLYPAQTDIHLVG